MIREGMIRFVVAASRMTATGMNAEMIPIGKASSPDRIFCPMFFPEFLFPEITAALNAQKNCGENGRRNLDNRGESGIIQLNVQTTIICKGGGVDDEPLYP